MASSIPSMSTTNNLPLSLSSSTSLSLINNNNNNKDKNNLNNQEESQSFNSMQKTITTTTSTAVVPEQNDEDGDDISKNLLKIKNVKYHQLQHHFQDVNKLGGGGGGLNPINFSSSSTKSTTGAEPAPKHYSSSSPSPSPPHDPNSNYNPKDNLRKERRLRKSSLLMLRSSRKRSHSTLSQNSNNVNLRSQSAADVTRGFASRRESISPLGSEENEHELLKSTKQSKFEIGDKSNSSSINKKDYHLKWDDYVQTTVSAIQSLLQNETFVDVTLVSDDTEEGDATQNLEKEPSKDVKKENRIDKIREAINEHNNNTIVNHSSKSDIKNEGHDDFEFVDDDDDEKDLRKSQTSTRKNKDDKDDGEVANAKTTTTIQEKEDQDQVESKKPSNPNHNDNKNGIKFKAHKVILSTYSDYFRRIFSENPCKHPVIVLKDFQSWEVAALLDFMYKGQVIVKPERLETLVKAAESLQIRGLKEIIEKSPEWKQRKVTLSSTSRNTNTGNSIIEKLFNSEEEQLVGDVMMHATTTDDEESTTSKCRPRRLRQQSREFNNLNKQHISKTRSNKLRRKHHNMKNILNSDDEDEDVQVHEGDDVYDDDDDEAVVLQHDDENGGPSSPKLLNLSTGNGNENNDAMLDSFPIFHHQNNQTLQSHQQHKPYNIYDEGEHEQHQLLRSSLSNNNNANRRFHRLHNRKNSQNASSSSTTVSVLTTDEPQTTDEHGDVTGGNFPYIHNHHGQTNLSSASPPFPRRKQARPRRRSGDFVAQDLRTTTGTTNVDSPYQSYQNIPHDDDIVLEMQQQQVNNNEVLDFTIGNNNNNNNNNMIKMRGGILNERLMPTSSQVNNFIANHFLKSWSSSTSGGSRIDSPTVQSPHHQHHLMTSSSLKHELDSEDILSSPLGNCRHSTPGTPETSSPPLSEHKNKPLLRRRRERLSRHRHHRLPQQQQQQQPLNHHNFNENEHLLIPFNNTSSPPTNYFLGLNNGHPPPPLLHHPQHPLSSGHHSDPESNSHIETRSHHSTPPKSFSPLGFPHSLSTGGVPGGGSHVGEPPGQQWPGLPLGPPPIFGRHRAQHSAPRGGPPRAWSNADLTEALHNVWNKKMTTSQASRIFGIPYNSLLMYVRGKYGKSLKLDLLKKGLDLAMLEKANSNNNNAGNNSSSGTSTGNRSSTPSGNNNNNNNQSNKSKSHSADSPPLSLNINSLMGGEREQQQHQHQQERELKNTRSSSSSISHHHHHQNNNNRNDPQDIIPSGFNPFSIFGDYPPPFPFSNAAAAAAALSHILPPPPIPQPPPPTSASSSASASNSNHIGFHGNKNEEKGNKSSHRRHHRSNSDIDK